MLKILISLLILVAIAVLALFAAARSSRRVPERTFELREGQLRPCPDSPNCVSSQESSKRARVERFDLAGESFETLVAWLDEQPGIALQRRDEGYAHLACRTGVLGFVDDLELALDAESGAVDVRSASRVGHSDMGANRSRIEGLQRAWKAHFP